MSQCPNISCALIKIKLVLLCQIVSKFIQWAVNAYAILGVVSKVNSIGRVREYGKSNQPLETPSFHRLFIPKIVTRLQRNQQWSVVFIPIVTKRLYENPGTKWKWYPMIKQQNRDLHRESDQFYAWERDFDQILQYKYVEEFFKKDVTTLIIDRFLVYSFTLRGPTRKKKS